MASTGSKQNMNSKYSLSDIAGYKSILVVLILLITWVLGFSARLFAVIRFESIIHEFDPW